ncbi:hypothetical protein ACQJBY_055977 [Aegilops geniculata]
MGRKRKSTSNGKTPPSKGRPCRKSVAAPSPVAVEVPEPPAASNMMVPHHPPKGGTELLKQARSAVAVSAAKEKVVKLDFDVPMRVLNCEVCHGLLKAPIFQCSLLRHIACRSCSECNGGKCLPCADLSAPAVYVRSSYLDTLFGHIKLKEACPYKKYGCTSSKPCWFRTCPFKGSPADLVRHLTGRHAMAAHKFTYGQDYIYDTNEMESSLVYSDEMDSWMVRYELFVGEDGGVFKLIVDLSANWQEFPFPLVTLVCVRNSAAAGLVYSYSVAAMDASPADRRNQKPEIKEVPGFSEWKLEHGCFPLLPGMLREEQTRKKSVLVRICISKDESSGASC